MFTPLHIQKLMLLNSKTKFKTNEIPNEVVNHDNKFDGDYKSDPVKIRDVAKTNDVKISVLKESEDHDWGLSEYLATKGHRRTMLDEGDYDDKIKKGNKGGIKWCKSISLNYNNNEDEFLDETNDHVVERDEEKMSNFIGMDESVGINLVKTREKMFAILPFHNNDDQFVLDREDQKDFGLRKFQKQKKEKHHEMTYDGFETTFVKLNNDVENDDDFLLMSRSKPGLGYKPYPKPNYIQFKRGETIQYVDNKYVEEFKSENTYGMYILKKWMKPDLDSLVKKLISSRARSNWRLLYVRVLRENNIQADIRESFKIRYNLMKESRLKYKQLYEECNEEKEKMLNKIIRYEYEITDGEYANLKTIVKDLERKLKFMEDEYYETLRFNSRLYQDIQNLSKIHFENTLRCFLKRSEEKKGYISIVNNKISEIDNVIKENIYTDSYEKLKNETNKDIDNKHIKSMKKMYPENIKYKNTYWFELIHDDELEKLWDLLETPVWLRKYNNINELPNNIYIERQALYEILKICKFKRNRAGFKNMYMILDRYKLDNHKNLKLKGIDKFEKTFDLVFDFRTDFENKKEYYLVSCEYMMLFCYSRNMHKNIEKLLERGEHNDIILIPKSINIDKNEL